MMIRSSSRGKGIEAKQEDEANSEDNNKNKATAPASTSSASSSRQWSAFRNPRIVRVSRSFGGKDRHSKVCTVRGLRDRRIRLSVPTAIQLYDLQDRLGLPQPSKVIDWLLDATKNDIDSLPPLQMPQGFGQFHPQLLLPHHQSSTPSPHLQSSFISPAFDTNLHPHHHHSLGIKMNTSSSFDEMVRSKPRWGAETEMEAEGSFRGGTNHEINGKGKLIRRNEEENEQNGLSLSAQKLFPLASSNSSLPSFFNINNPPNMALNSYNNYHNWDASNLSLSQFGIVPQPPEINNSLSLTTNNTSAISMPPPSSLAGAGGSQFFFCPPPPVTFPTFFPQYPTPFATHQLENNETREITHFQLLNSGFGSSQRNNSTGRQPHKDQNADP